MRSVVQVATPQPKKSVSSVQIGKDRPIVFVAPVYSLAGDFFKATVRLILDGLHQVGQKRAGADAAHPVS